MGVKRRGADSVSALKCCSSKRSGKLQRKQHVQGRGKGNLPRAGVVRKAQDGEEGDNDGQRHLSYISKGMKEMNCQ